MEDKTLIINGIEYVPKRELKYAGGCVCPNCGNRNSKVSDSRPSVTKGSRWRRRTCSKCDTTWSTIEIIMQETDAEDKAVFEEIKAKRDAMSRYRSKSRYYMRKAQGLCTVCSRPNNTTHSVCPECSKRRREERAKREAYNLMKKYRGE